MNILAIDIGNSRIKWGHFHGSELIGQQAFEYECTSLEQLLDHKNIPVEGNKVVISNVAGKEVEKIFIEWFKVRGCDEYVFAETKLELCGVANAYDLPYTLGVDRWLCMVAAYHHVKKADEEGICVIDCGTAVTLDVIDPQGLHKGGLIMPGLQTMKDALLRKTKGVRVDAQIKNMEMEKKLATSTENAVDIGCAQLMIEGLSGMVKKYQQSADYKLHCFVTGGDGSWVSKNIGLVNTFDAHLVLQGLRLMYENNTSANMQNK